MRDPRRSRALRALAAWIPIGCAAVDPTPDYDRARREIAAISGVDEVHDPEAPVLTAEEIDAILADGLTSSESTRLALLNNRRLHAGFLALGVARADYVQAGLLENPSLSLAFLFPDGGGRVRWTADLLGSIADVWRLPARRSVASAGVDLSILELSRFAGELVASTTEAYFRSVAAREARSFAAEGVELARRTHAAIERRVQEGVTSAMDVALANGDLLAAELALRRAEREELTTQRRLAALLSLERDIVDVALVDPLPEPAPMQVDRDAVVAERIASRPDLRAAARAVELAEAQVELERARRFPSLGVGVSAERPEGDGATDLLVGPAATLELPIFDRNSARVSGAELELAGRRKEYEALSADAKQSLRAALDRAVLASETATFVRGTLVPHAERTVELAERALALGDTTVLVLLDAQRSSLEARRTELETLLEAALSRVAAEREAGAPLEWTAGRSR